MRKFWAIFLCLALLAGLCACGEVVQHGPPAPPEITDTSDTMTQELTVMSFNVYTRNMGGRKNGVLRTILRESPDSVGLQEAHGRWRVFLRRELCGKTYGIGIEYAMACAKGRYAGIGEGVPILYRSDKYDLLEEGVFWLSETPRRASLGWDATIRPRVAGYAVLRDRNTGFTYVHFNAHFDNRGEIARVNSARMIADRINEMGLPAVFTGDINAGPDELPAQYLEAGGLTDLRFYAAETDTGATLPDWDAVLDYVYANHFLRGAKEFKVIRDEYDGMYPSDHFAVAATLTLAN